MRITWVVSAPITQTASGGLTSDLASARYRVLIPGMELANRHNVHLVTINEDIDPHQVKEVVDTDVVIISKSFGSKTEVLAQRALDAGIPVLLDICDDHFSTPNLSEHYKTLCAMATGLVASTRAMAEVIEENTGKPATVVVDPYEMQQAAPHFRLDNGLDLMWFGHPVNFDSLLDFIPKLNQLQTDVPITFRIVSSFNTQAQQAIAVTMRQLKIEVNAKLVPWSMAEMHNQLATADIVVIPSLDQQKKQVKSPNRLVEAMWSGCYVVANEVPAYQDFNAWACVQPDLIEGIQQALTSESTVNQKITGAQQYIATQHSPQAVAVAWENCIQTVLATASSTAGVAQQSAIPPVTPMPPVDAPQTTAAPEPTSVPVESEELKRLNLGCGDKILPGYINVDVAEVRAGMRPDVLCDLHKLEPFEDNSVDEILSVHVVEHFWRWEVIDILKEWVRVLKPGGRMILECPNLISACETFLQNPDLHAGEGPEGQRTMWVFYGDPKWQDPLMNHRWAYTPKSLAQTMASAGLVNMRQEPAQFKLREPRDMRIVADKPL